MADMLFTRTHGRDLADNEPYNVKRFARSRWPWRHILPKFVSITFTVARFPSFPRNTGQRPGSTWFRVPVLAGPHTRASEVILL
jgi:hypothetical protein